MKKRYGTHAISCDRLLRRDDVSEESNTMLQVNRTELDPATLLLDTMPETQPALATINANDSRRS